MGRKGNRATKGSGTDTKMKSPIVEKPPIVEEPQYNLSDFSPSSNEDLDADSSGSDEIEAQGCIQSEPKTSSTSETALKKDNAETVSPSKPEDLDMELEDERPDPSKPKATVIPLVKEDTEEAATATAHLLIARVAGKFPGRKAISEFIKGWNCVLSTHPSGWLILEFNTMENLKSVMQNGPYYIQGCQLVLQVMPDLFDFRTDELFKVPLWVQFPNLPLQLWTKSALSKIASQFGKPMYADHKTRTKKRFSFARVLIEVDVSQKPPDSITLRLPNGECIEQVAIFEFWPKSCTTCKAIGHETTSCHRTNASHFPENRKKNRRKPMTSKKAAASDVLPQGQNSEPEINKHIGKESSNPGPSRAREVQLDNRWAYKATGRRIQSCVPILEPAGAPPVDSTKNRTAQPVQELEIIESNPSQKLSKEVQNYEGDGIKTMVKENLHKVPAKPYVKDIKSKPPTKSGKGGPSTSNKKV